MKNKTKIIVGDKENNNVRANLTSDWASMHTISQIPFDFL